MGMTAWVLCTGLLWQLLPAGHAQPEGAVGVDRRDERGARRQPGPSGQGRAREHRGQRRPAAAVWQPGQQRAAGEQP